MTFESLRDAFVEAERVGEDAYWRSGWAWHWLRRHRFFKRYKNPHDFLTQELAKIGFEPPSPAELAKRARVATTFDESVTRSLTVENLYLALTLFDKLNYTTFNRDDPGNERIQVPQADGSVITKRLQQCNRHDLLAANRAASGKKPADSGLSPGELAAQKLGQAALAKLVGEDGDSDFRLLHKAGKDFFRLKVEMEREKISRLISVLGGLFR